MSRQVNLTTEELSTVFLYTLQSRVGLTAPPNSRLAKLSDADLRQAFIASHSRDLLQIWGEKRQHHLLQPDDEMLQRVAKFMLYIAPGQYPFLDEYAEKYPEIVNSEVTSVLIGFSTQLAANRALFLAIASEPQMAKMFADELGLTEVQCQISRALVVWDTQDHEEQLEEISEATGKPIEQLLDFPGVFDPIITRASSSFRDTWAIMAVLHSEVTRLHQEQFNSPLSKEDYQTIMPKLKSMLLNVSSKGRSRFAEKMDALLVPNGIILSHNEKGNLSISFALPEFSQEAMSAPYVVCPATMAHGESKPTNNVLSGLIDKYFDVVIDSAFNQNKPSREMQINL